MVRALILNSRQQLRPTGSDEWVRRTVEAVEYVGHHYWNLLTSVGMPTWDLVTTLGVMMSIPMTVCIQIPFGDDIPSVVDAWQKQFGWDEESVFPAPVVTAQEGPLAAQMSCSLRDHALVYEADVILPISVRKGGNLASMLTESRRPGTRVDDRFKMPYARSRKSVGYIIDKKELNPELAGIADSWLIHWTRASNTAWPTERLCDYYHDVINAIDYPRSAFQTLQHMLKTKCIVGSGRHMPGNEPMVSLSSLPPDRAVDLMRWRSRYRQMSFEPYGIAIRRPAAEKIGIVPVKYYDGKLPSNIPDNERWQWQSKGKIGDWQAEHEYRHRGDLSLDRVPRDDLRIITRFPNEKTAIERDFGFEAVLMTVDS